MRTPIDPDDRVQSYSAGNIRHFGFMRSFWSNSIDERFRFNFALHPHSARCGIRSYIL